MNDTYLPSSASTTLTVQQTPIPAAITSEPLPTNYWTHPIYGENSNWYTISSNWLGSGSPALAGYTTSAVYRGDAVGPLTAHVMWTQPLEMGGIVGGNLFPTAQGVGYFEGSAYQQRFSNPIIIDGYLFYTETVSFTGPSSGPTDCVNLQTGQLVWSSTKVPTLSFGYIYDVWNGEQHGVFPPILFTANFAQAFDAYTGTALFNVTNVPTGTAVAGPSGEQLRLVFANAGTAAAPQWYLAEWNSSKLWQYDVNPYTFGGSLSPSIINATNGVLISTDPIPMAGTTGTLPNGASITVPYGSAFTVNANIPINSTTVYPTNLGAQTTYDWNISLPWLNIMPLVTQATLSAGGEVITVPTAGSNPVTVVAVNPGDVMLCRNATLPGGFMRVYSGFPQLPYTLFTVNLNASVGAIGSILWMKNYNPPAGNLTLTVSGVDWQTRTFVINYGETMQWVGYSLDTGALLWGPTAPQAAFDYYTTSYGSTLAYGNLYSSGYAGICYCYNDLTGALEWTYGNGGAGNSTNAGFNTGYGDYPTAVSSIGNGVVYLVTEEHTSTDPIYKGALARAINATTGQEIWTLSDYASASAGASVIADGYAALWNGYDDQIYTVGQGPSATTVQAPQTAITAGNNVVIQGTVMDTSAGTKQTAQAADFPNGVPCSSDASMTTWMGYVYQQQAEPTNFTGVTVSIDATDPNGNFITLGTATTDTTGHFIYAWQTPNVPGKYTVTATFAGTNGYWPSNAETGMIIQNAPATPAPTATPVTGLATMSGLTIGIAAAVIAIIIAIAIVGLLLLRKKP
jgi:hypothetical protein